MSKCTSITINKDSKTADIKEDITNRKQQPDIRDPKMRIIQKNLVYLIGLPVSLNNEKVFFSLF